LQNHLNISPDASLPNAMNPRIELAPRSAFPGADIDAMHRLRAQVFGDRLGWDVNVIDGREVDVYDLLEPHYMLVRLDGEIRGCWRLLPTTGPYMLRDVFPQLLGGQAAPCSPAVWELSRFVMDPSHRAAGGFASSTISSMQEAVRFAARMGIERYVTVTTLPMERLLRRTGLSLTRCGAPAGIGREQTVALDIPMGPAAAAALAHAQHALLSPRPPASTPIAAIAH
jgi:acyl homoserine lactone synthase